MAGQSGLEGDHEVYMKRDSFWVVFFRRHFPVFFRACHDAVDGMCASVCLAFFPLSSFSFTYSVSSYQIVYSVMVRNVRPT